MPFQVTFKIASKTSGQAPATLSDANLTRSLLILIFAMIIVLESNLSVHLLGKHLQYNNVNLRQKRMHL